MTATLVCAYPGCEITSGLERCSECGKIVCPQHRTLRNGTYVCLMCDEARPTRVEEERQVQVRQAEQARMDEERRNRQAIAERAIALHRGASAETPISYRAAQSAVDYPTPAAPQETGAMARFRAWSGGGKTIFIASLLALLALFLPWVDIGIATRNGFATGGFLWLVFYIYPVVKLLNNGDMNKAIGGISGILAVVLTFFTIRSQTLFGANVSSTGAFLFLVTSIILALGVFAYENPATPRTW